MLSSSVFRLPSKTGIEFCKKSAHMIRQHQQIMLLAIAIAHMLAEHALDPKAQPLEDRTAKGLLLDHLDNHLGHAQLARGIEDRLGHDRAKPFAAHIRSG